MYITHHQQVGGEKDGVVTRNEFENYYSNLGASIDNEDYFELMIRNAWHISGGEGAAANSANKRVLVTHADGRQTVEEIQNDLGLRSDDKEGMMARLRAQGVSAASISSSDVIGKRHNPSHLRNSMPAGILPGPGSTFNAHAPKSAAKKDGAAVLSHAPVGVRLAVDRLKVEIKSRGGTGFIALQRKFRILDDDGSKTLNLAEFKKGMKEMNMGLGDAELRQMFDQFDQDGSGTIDFEEFIQGVRDPLTARRLALVSLAFAKLDTDGSGIVDAAELASLYDASKHPEVISGRMTTTDVLAQFLDTFEVKRKRGGRQHSHLSTVSCTNTQCHPSFQ
jgi:Ca2+-binding EF-hand superfamily protein